MENDDNIILSIGETLTLIALWKGNIFYWLFYLEYTCKMCVFVPYQKRNLIISNTN
jgi:hypothetical protein